ncbi:MAG TPA: formate dehydrogenase subunit delta [Dermatophilaceae bacterium]|nr:formate dehydrogenase subunit delta [Dermatophilaceae bacterium]
MSRWAGHDEPAVIRLSADVARQLAHLPEGSDRSAELATHLTKFWERRMIRELVARVRAGEAGIDPLVVAAVHDVLAGQVDAEELREPSGG